VDDTQLYLPLKPGDNNNNAARPLLDCLQVLKNWMAKNLSDRRGLVTCSDVTDREREEEQDRKDPTEAELPSASRFFFLKIKNINCQSAYRMCGLCKPVSQTDDQKRS